MASSKDILFDIARRLMPDNEAPPLKIAGVEASAGSGKTYLLTTLYIFLSLLGELTGEFGFQNILAITFTNEAADEMKRRVFSRLRRMALFKYGKNIEKEREARNDTVFEKPEKGATDNEAEQVIMETENIDLSLLTEDELEMLMQLKKELTRLKSRLLRSLAGEAEI